jgi:subtilisin family serine protease
LQTAQRESHPAIDNHAEGNLMSYSRIPWTRRLMALAALFLILAAAPAQNSLAQDRIAAQNTPDWTAPRAPGQLLVKLSDASQVTAATLAAQTGMAVQNTIPQLGIVVVEVPGAGTNEALATTAAALEANPAIEWAEPNYIFTVDSADLVPNDPYYATTQATYLGRLQMPGAWGYTTGQPAVVIAILDTGLMMGHEDLRGGVWTNSDEIPANGVDDDNNGFVDDINGWNFPDANNHIYDDYGHGTHVAGIAAARINNGIGIAGMAGGATIMPVDVFNYGIGTYEDLIQAIIYATDNGARVINMSLGATSYSRGEEAAVDYAWNHGVVVVAAAGNTGRNTYHYPAAHRNAIAVAATDATDKRAGFSTFGDFVDIAAPGVSVLSTLMSGGYGGMSGTSMATPHVAGLAALIFSLNPQLTNAQVRELIETNVDDLGAAGWDPYFGSGRINAGKSLAAATPPPLSEWPAGCLDLIADGGFETGLGSWQASGAWAVDATRAYAGTGAAHFTGGPNATGALRRTLRLVPAAGAFPKEATLWFAYRIENQDTGWGSSPEAPYDDWLTAEFRSIDGSRVSSLLRTGNSADTANDGLPWDRYLYRMQPADFRPLAALGTVDLIFAAGNDADAQPTSFWIDGVRLCVSPPPYRHFLPMLR